MLGDSHLLWPLFEVTVSLLQLELDATIQNVEPVHASNKAGTKVEFQHGIQFKETDARVVLLVHELQQRKH